MDCNKEFIKLGINRIRLEFKEQGIATAEATTYSINRIRLEFKVLNLSFAVGMSDQVLIESDWNLKVIETVAHLT